MICIHGHHLDIKSDSIDQRNVRLVLIPIRMGAILLRDLSVFFRQLNNIKVWSYMVDWGQYPRLQDAHLESIDQ